MKLMLGFGHATLRFRDLGTFWAFRRSAIEAIRGSFWGNGAFRYVLDIGARVARPEQKCQLHVDRCGLAIEHNQ